MQIETTPIKDVLLIVPPVYSDSRGFFQELYHHDRYAEAGLNVEFVQDNFSRSCRGVLRGLHFQTQKPQGKLVQVLRGTLLDVVVDLRHDSPTLGQWHSWELSEHNHHQLYIPPGLAHGFLALDEDCDLLYKCTELYQADDQNTLAWDDETVGIQWPTRSPILSGKDLEGVSFDAAVRATRNPLRDGRVHAAK